MENKGHSAPPTEELAAGARHPLQALLREVFGSFLPAVLIVAGVNLFVAQPRTVEGESMEPSLFEDQRLIVELLTYRFTQPARGEIIVLNLRERATGPLIKRVIGLPGEIVEVRDGQVFIDGEPLQEPYLAEPTAGVMLARLVPEEHVFVMGDNRNASNDSRYFGMVPFEEIIGHAWLRYWPPHDAGVLP